MVYLSTNIRRSYPGQPDDMRVKLDCGKDGHGVCGGRADRRLPGIQTTPTRDILSRVLGRANHETLPGAHNTSQRTRNIIGQFMSTRYKGPRGGSYIVYDCSINRRGQCGGWADRLSGILTTFVIALLTNKTFLINHDNPCVLEDFLVPGEHDWRYNATLLSGRTNTYKHLVDGSSNHLRTYFSGKEDINTCFSTDVSFLRMNWDYTTEFRKRPNISSEVPWITKLNYADIYRELFNFLFKPSVLLDRELKNLNRTKPKMACSHVRVGDNLKRPSGRAKIQQQLEVLWKFMDAIDKTVYDIFVASDDETVANKAKERYKENFIDIKGPITHIDQTTHRAYDGFLKQLLDFYTLTRCDILIIGCTGFGIMAGYVRNSEADLYCYKDGNNTPCARSTLEDVFPGHILAPY